MDSIPLEHSFAEKLARISRGDDPIEDEVVGIFGTGSRFKTSSIAGIITVDAIKHAGPGKAHKNQHIISLKYISFRYYSWYYSGNLHL